MPGVTVSSHAPCPSGWRRAYPRPNIRRMKKQLWLRLTRYHFDNLVPAHLVDHVTAAFGGADASTKAFASKLARKLGWTTGFSLRAIGEYKKFVYLGAVSDFSVTPPRVIDQVWHEHLLFSRAYRDFCRTVIERDFDHNPELVPTTGQTDVFKAQYVATLDLYSAEFNTDPPDDIWGTPKFRVSGAAKTDRTRKGPAGENSPSSAQADVPLYLLFDGSGNDGSHHGMSEFGGGGGFAGGGGGGLWGAHSSAHADTAAGASGQSDDAGGGDSGGGGSDSGGGSGCSSSCGGGGCSS